MTSTDVIKSALAEQDDRASAPTVYAALDIHRASLERKVPTGQMTYAYAEAALKTELRNTPKLREADPASLLQAFAYTLQLGLPLGPLGLAYLVPFKGEVVPIVGYLGKIELGYRSGLVKDVSGALVYEGDPFKVKGGTRPGIEHEIGPRAGREIVAAYAVAHLKTGGTVHRAIFEEDWEKSRQASALGRANKGLWADDFPAAVLKTAYHRLFKDMPKTPQLILAEQVDEQPAGPFVSDVDAEALGDE